ncbi:MAG: hypothetical protein OJF50_006621 [Nitrospira sp.]|jgi:hypothetical protein|nr:hypothetical protein [Nitrospira sp.]
MPLNTGETELSMVGYQFTTVITLRHDYAEGRFHLSCP